MPPSLSDTKSNGQKRTSSAVDLHGVFRGLLRHLRARHLQERYRACELLRHFLVGHVRHLVGNVFYRNGKVRVSLGPEHAR